MNIHVCLFFYQDRFTSVSLAIKTDKMTLDQRMVVHKRARDTIEQNIETELKGLKQAVQVWVQMDQNRLYVDVY